MAPRTRAATRAERVHLPDLPAEILEDLARQLSTADHASLALTCRPLAAAVANVAKPVAQMLNELGLGGVPIHESLQHNTTIVRALKKVLKRKRRWCGMDGNDYAAEAEALSLIIACEHQAARGKLVQDLLYLGFSTWPPEGCVFDLSLLPPPLEALKAYDTFEPGEWDDMFEALAEYGENNMVRRWGPGLVDACTAYYKKFGESHYTADLDLPGKYM
jgi:hypothetical protein